MTDSFVFPNADAVPFSFHSGKIDVSSTRSLFYILAEADRTDPNFPFQKDADVPLLLFLNGGPGCSSMLGLFEENGPFTAVPNKRLAINPYAWNKVAHVLYLDSPANVGFSTSTDPSDNNVGDARTAADTLTFLVKFLTLVHPELLGNPLYITGESYAGHYVPNAVKAVIDYNRNAAIKLNLVGLMSGNPWTDGVIDNIACPDYWQSHGLISKDVADGAKQYCDWITIYDPTARARMLSSRLGKQGARGTDRALCTQFLAKARAQRGNINLFEILQPLCLNTTTTRSSSGAAQMRPADVLERFKSRVLDDAGPFSAASVDEGSPSVRVDACVDAHTSAYLNDPAIQSVVTRGAPHVTWASCNPHLNYSITDTMISMIPVYQYIVANSSARLLVYSGDLDGVVPFVGTKNWIQGNLTGTGPGRVTQVSKYRPWHVDEDIGGWWTRYSSNTPSTGELWYSTVRGAGHMVPGTQPDRSLRLVRAFLLNSTLA